MQSDGVDLWYFKLWLFDLPRTKVWNFKGLRNRVVNINGLKNQNSIAENIKFSNLGFPAGRGSGYPNLELAVEMF